MDRYRKNIANGWVKRLLLLSILSLALLCFGFFAQAEGLGHDCDGDDCPICAMVQMVQGNAASDDAGASAPAGPVFLLFASAGILLAGSDLKAASPISLHIRIDS